MRIGCVTEIPAHNPSPAGGGSGKSVSLGNPEGKSVSLGNPEGKSVSLGNPEGWGILPFYFRNLALI